MYSELVPTRSFRLIYQSIRLIRPVICPSSSIFEHCGFLGILAVGDNYDDDSCCCYCCCLSYTISMNTCDRDRDRDRMGSGGGVLVLGFDRGNGNTTMILIGIRK